MLSSDEVGGVEAVHDCAFELDEETVEIGLRGQFAGGEFGEELLTLSNRASGKGLAEVLVDE